MLYRFEVYMKLIDRKRLAKLMAIQDVTQRELATAAGWKSHGYVTGLLSGQYTTLKPEPAARIAAYLGVGVDDLFLARPTSGEVKIVKQRKSRRVAA